MKRSVLIASSSVLTLVILAGGAVLLAPAFIDFNQYKAQAQEQIKKSTGFDVTLDGDVSLGLFPPHLELEKIKVLSPAGFTNPNLASFESLEVNVELMPLLSKKVNVTGINIVDPAIFLEVDSQGRQNWMTEELRAMSDKPADEAAANERDQADQAPEIKLSNVKITNGQLWYKFGAGAPIIVKDMNLDIDGDSLKGPFDVEGSLHAMEQNLKLDASIGEMKGEGAPLAVKVEGELKPADIEFKYAGAFDMEKMDTQGEAEVEFDKGKLEGILKASQQKIELQNMDLTYDKHKVTGSVETTLNPIKFDSKVKVDGADMNVSGSYAQDLTVAVRAKQLNFDSLMMGKPPAAAAKEAKETKPNDKPLSQDELKKQTASINVPMTINFDVAVDNAIYQAQNVKMLKAQGVISKNALNLKNFSVDNIAGASLQSSVAVNDLKNLSGIQAKITSNVNNMKEFAAFTKMDLSALPEQVKNFAVNADLAGDLNALNTTASITALSGSVTAKGIVQDPLGSMAMKDLAVQIKHPNMNQALKIFSPSAPQYDSWSKPMDITANIDMKDKVTNLTNIKATLAGTNASGNLKIDGSGAKPDISGALEFGALSMRESDTKAAGGSENTAAAGSSNGGGKWSSEAMDSAWLSSMNMNLDIKAQSLVYQTWDLDKPEIKFVMKDGALDIKNLKAGLYGGQLDMNTQMKAADAKGKGLNVAADVKFTNVDLEKLAGSFIGTKIIKASGNADLTTKVSGSGISQKALISSLGGSGALTGKNIVLEGFDLTRFARAMDVENKPGDTVLGLWKTSTKGGQTAFNTMDGAYTINSGIVNISKLDMDGDTALMQTTGNVNLPNWTVATKHSIKVKGSEAPPFTVEISGPLDNPGQTFAQGAIQNYLEQKLQRKLGSVLEDKLGVQAGDEPLEQRVLNKFLGDKLKKAQPVATTTTPAATTATTPTVAPAPSAAPAATATTTEPAAAPAATGTAVEPAAGDAAPAAATIAPAEQPAAAPAEQKPEDAMKDILNGLIQQ